MGRKAFRIEPIERLISLSKHSINLCEICTGCSLHEKIKKLEAEAWADHRQSVKLISYRCNSFNLNPDKAKIAPPFRS